MNEFGSQGVLHSVSAPNPACTRLVGLLLRSVRVFKQFVWLKVGFGKMALSCPAYQRIKHTVIRCLAMKAQRLHSLSTLSILVFGRRVHYDS
jgi:hypothetical protein